MIGNDISYLGFYNEQIRVLLPTKTDKGKNPTTIEEFFSFFDGAVSSCEAVDARQTLLISIRCSHHAHKRVPTTLFPPRCSGKRTEGKMERSGHRYV
ncbi:hypothetical protein BLNAU_10347 [Blattamonas nauphoetae]|uniref:Transposase n=1 Tax=Blattamonas nauphoetae TaxID=2049346 RepID=A0ABQ9XT86_9EUKA|nr:hypothetical protein BLNAU_10347 [Blattamonas nauphoetae]